MDKEALDKLVKRRHYKLRGVVSTFEWVNSNKSIGQLIVTKGSGANKKSYVFTAFVSKSLALEQINKGYRIKIWFSIQCNQYSGKWYTNMVVESFEHWVVNEDKIKRLEYQKSLAQSQQKIEWGNTDFDT